MNLWKRCITVTVGGRVRMTLQFGGRYQLWGVKLIIADHVIFNFYINYFTGNNFNNRVVTLRQKRFSGPQKYFEVDTALCGTTWVNTPLSGLYGPCFVIFLSSKAFVRYSTIIGRESLVLGSDEGQPPAATFQIVSSKTLTRPLQLKKGKPAGKGSITVRTESVCV